MINMQAFKRIFTATLLSLLAVSFTFAQKFGYVDVKKVLQNMDEYKAAKSEIDNLSSKWTAELNDMYKNIAKMEADLIAEEVLLPEDIKKERQAAIQEEKDKAAQFKKEKFGYGGELYAEQDKIIQPIQDRVYDAIEKMAQEKKLDFIIDKSANVGIIYYNPLYDRTDDVFNKLGLKPAGK